MMNQLNATELRKNNIKIDWLQNKKTAPFCQGMAINKLLKEYHGSNRYGYFLINNRELKGMEEGCYYLIEKRTKYTDDQTISNALIAFKEYGTHIQGHTIFKNSDEYFAMPEDRD